MTNKLTRYFWRVLIGLDQFSNTLLGGFPDETLSARTGRLKDSNPVAHTVASVLDHIQPNHVEMAIESERLGKQQDPAYADVYTDEIVVTLKDSECQ